jgi:hypothetical protein
MKQRNKNLTLQARIKAWENLKPSEQKACKKPGSQKK